jgi:hypothetical protein
VVPSITGSNTVKIYVLPPWACKITYQKESKLNVKAEADQILSAAIARITKTSKRFD